MPIQVGARSLTLAQATDLLTTHLKAIVAVEFFTIPVYLTSIYSFSAQGLSYVDPNAGEDGDKYPLYSMQQKALSVAVQEMLHLQLACNLVNSLGDTPDIPTLPLDASQTIEIPHLKQKDGQPQTMKLGNLPEAIDAFIGIEAPDPSGTFPQPNDTAEYSSIADLYHATLELLGLVATEAYNTSTPTFTDRNQVAYGTFPPTYPNMPMRVTSPESAVTAANAIADQGEGQTLTENNSVAAAQRLSLYVFGNKAPNDEGNVAPQFRPELTTRFGKWGNWAHYNRFEQIKATLASPEFQTWDAAVRAEYKKLDPSLDLGAFYPGSGNPITTELPAQYTITAAEVNNSNNLTWSWITEQLSSGFADGQLNPTYSTDPDAPNFTEAMLSFKYVIPMIWRFAEVPSFLPQTGVTGKQVQDAMDIIDPLCLFHWDAKTRGLRTLPFFKQNACHGLNTCQGMGWGGFGTKPGDGACASADPHTCGGNNDCGGRGGCGFLVSPTGESCSASGKKLQSVHATKILRGGAAPGPLCGNPKAPKLLSPCEEWIPGMNDCATKGGCETPISTGQMFSSAAKDSISKQGPHGGWTEQAKQALLDLAGTPVWDEARRLLANASGGDLGDPHPPETVGNIIYDGKLRRSMIQPTSPA